MSESSGPRHTGPALEAAYRFSLWVVPCVDGFPRSRKFTLGARIETASLDLIRILVAATYARARRGLLDEANLQVDQLRLLLRLAKDLRAIDMRRYEFAARSLDEIGRMIGGWRKTSDDAPR
jgi:hypothetical protein